MKTGEKDRGGVRRKSGNQNLGLNLYYDKSYAMVIGIDDYGGRHPRLVNARNDAEAVAEILKEQYGFTEVYTLYDQDATQKNIQHKLKQDLVGKLKRNDRLVFFFAGHGTTRKGNNGTYGYLIPQDAQEGNYADYIEMDVIQKACDLIEAKHLFFILDCCFSGVAAITTRSAPKEPSLNKNDHLLKEMTTRKAYQVLTAGASDEVVADSGGRIGHSPFTSALLEGLEGAADTDDDGLLTAHELAYYVKAQVIRSGKNDQTPFYNHISGSKNGDLVLLRPQSTTSLPKQKVADPMPLISKTPSISRKWFLSTGMGFIGMIIIAYAVGSGIFRDNQGNATTAFASTLGATATQTISSTVAPDITTTTLAEVNVQTTQTSATELTTTSTLNDPDDDGLWDTGHQQSFETFSTSMVLPTFTPTAIVTQTATPQPVTISLPVCNTITIIEPTHGSVITGQHARIRWHCNGYLPSEYSFEIKLYLPGATPFGAHDAMLDASRIQPIGENYEFWIGVEDAAGFVGRGKDYQVTVSKVRIAPDYQDTGMTSDPVTVAIQ